MGTNLFVRSLFQTSFDIFAPGRHSFKFDQAWTLAELLLTGLRPPTGSMASMLHIGEGGGVAPDEMCTEVRYPCEATVTSHASL